MAGFSFVVADPSTGKTASTDRKLIRSHCMKGKNKREDSRRSRRLARQSAKLTAPTPQDQQSQSAGVYPPHAAEIIYRPRPRALPPLMDSAVVQVATQAGLAPEELLYNYMILNRLKFMMFPTYKVVDFKRMNQTTDQWIPRDAIFANAVLAVTSIYINPSPKGLPRRSPRFHRMRTISLLNEQLSQDVAKLSPSRIHVTFYIVITLGIIAAELGNYAEIGVHLLGMKRLIELIGGFHCPTVELPFYFELERLDLTYSLATGNTPLFINAGISSPESISWDPVFDLEPEPGDSASSDAEAFAAQIRDPRLATVFRDLRGVAEAANARVARGARVPGVPFRRTISAAQARLLLLRGRLTDVADECLRLGLLAFLSVAMFQSPATYRGSLHALAYARDPSQDRGSVHHHQQQQQQHENASPAVAGGTRSRTSLVAGRHDESQDRRRMHIASQLRDVCRAVEPSDPHLRRLLFWVLTVAAMSVFDVGEEPWLVGKWAHVAGEMETATHLLPSSSWDAARAELRRVIWIDPILDAPGRKLYARLATHLATTSRTGS